jgi:hypothetical protein
VSIVSEFELACSRQDVDALVVCLTLIVCAVEGDASARLMPSLAGGRG